jgi:acyl-CoA synthetase (AMP-forming)/AMP-acid ligase II
LGAGFAGSQAEAGSFNISSLLTLAAEELGDEPAIISKSLPDARGRNKVSFKELEEDSTLLASGLINMGLAPGARVAVLSGHGPDFHTIIYALFKAGLVPVVADPGMGARRFLECLSGGRPQAMIGVPKAHAFSLLFKGSFKDLKYRITLGRRWGWGGTTVKKLLNSPGPSHHPVKTFPDTLAAVLFTSGATGPAKGVLYTHGMFRAQVEAIKANFNLSPRERNLISFPLFGLFTPALKLTGVIPDMDPLRPGQADPKKILASMEEEKVESLFASPALLTNLKNYAKDNSITIPNIRTVICAGAPVRAYLAAEVKEILPKGALLFTPYGATEAMPLTRIEADEIEKARGMSEQGFGACLGKVIEGHEIRVIGITDKVIKSFSEKDLLPQGEVGEFVAKGPVVAESYFELPEATALSVLKGPDGNIWRRMGDVGWRDASGRLWFCGRKSQRVTTSSGSLFTVSCEAIFNNHPEIKRSALVGVGLPGSMTPVIVVEPQRKLTAARWKTVIEELSTLAKANPRTRAINIFLLHKNFPMDVRHNAKIGREKLTVWATKELAKLRRESGNF